MNDSPKNKSNNKTYIAIAVLVVIIGLLVYKANMNEGSDPAASQVTQTTQRNQTNQTNQANQALPQPAQYFKVDTNQPVWLLFRSTTCVPCKAMQKTMDELRPEFEGKVQFIAIDVNDPANREVLEKFQIMYIPTTYLYDAKQNLWKQSVSAIPTSEMREVLNQLAEAK